VDSILWAIVGGILVALLGSFLEGLFGLTRPIVPESETELRQRLKAQDRSLVYTFLKARPIPLASEDALLEIPGPAPDIASPQAVPASEGAVEAVDQAAAGPEGAATAIPAAEEEVEA